MANEMDPKKTIERYQPNDLNIQGISIREFSPKTIRTSTAKEYQAVKQQFGSFASTDVERKTKSGKAASFELHPDARRLLGVEQEEISQLSESIQNEVDAKIAELRQEAQKSGFELGLKEGRASGEKTAVAEAQGHFDRLKVFLDSVEQMKADLWAANERTLIDLLFQISKQIMLQDLKHDRDYVVRLTKEIIEKIGIRENIKIRVSPKDFEEIDYLKSKLNSEVGELKNLQILVSDEVSEGGCKIDSELTEVDASIMVQLDQLREALDGKSGDTST